MRLSRFLSTTQRPKPLASFCFTVVTCVILVAQTGCLGLVSNLIHAAGGDKSPAAYDGLEDSKVAVITITENSQFSDDVSARLLTANVAQWLKKEVDDIELVRSDEVANWRDTHGWDQIQFDEIGRGVDAEQVVAIEMNNLKLREGATLYRGRCDVHVAVIDAKTGEELFTTELEDFTYPKTAGVSSTEMTETRFRKLYLGILAKRVARQFFPYDARDDFALDSIIAR